MTDKIVWTHAHLLYVFPSLILQNAGNLGEVLKIAEGGISRMHGEICKPPSKGILQVSFALSFQIAKPERIMVSLYLQYLSTSLYAVCLRTSSLVVTVEATSRRTKLGG